MSKYTADSFCTAWVKNALGRKTQYSSFYVQKFDHMEFLCFYNSLGNQPAPYVLAARCRTSGLLLLDNYNYLHIMKRLVPSDILDAYSKNRIFVSFEKLNEDSGDLAEMHAMDHARIQNKNLVLFDINGKRYYTDATRTNYCANRKEYLAFADMKSQYTFEMGLLKAPNHCTSIYTARRDALPPELGEFKLFGRFFLIESPEIELQTSRELFYNARWVPDPRAWGVPDCIIYGSRGSGLNYEYSGLSTAAFEKRIHQRFPVDMAKNILDWKKAWDKYTEAERNILKKTDLGSVHPISYSRLDAWTDGGKRFLRNTIWDDVRSINLGPTWHRLKGR